MVLCSLPGKKQKFGPSNKLKFIMLPNILFLLYIWLVQDKKKELHYDFKENKNPFGNILVY